MNYNSPKSIQDILSTHGLALQKKFGQNFLISKDVREHILSVIDIDPGSAVPAQATGMSRRSAGVNIWEIGPGLGNMTALILEKMEALCHEHGKEGKLFVFEIDKGFIKILKNLFVSKIEVIEGDFIKTWKKHKEAAGMPDRIFGNLPYNSASLIIAALIEENSVPEKMVFTVQKEAAQRIAAKPGTKDYSSFSILCQIACNIKIEADIKGGAFFPVPDVTSSLISMTPHNKYAGIKDRKLFSRFLRTIFQARRKTILNNLKIVASTETITNILRQENIPPTIRAEALEISQIVSLFERISGCIYTI
ncbi:MAG: 16S rRNA (adenine(1518)-N(6)/adenine(1519)-N(6))-dimethyltransferase RsmA [Spirochaetes bacterium]|nr:16S rRNA (adenine(1518)-N(6)/adenine(1519)-N(6))-dimethyltransferase RsmA [Spirochaetota bacterium]